MSPGGAAVASAATLTVEPGASISEPPWNQTEPAVSVMLPGVKVTVGSEVVVSPSSSGRSAVIEPGPKVSEPARRSPGSLVWSDDKPLYVPPAGFKAIPSSAVEIVMEPGKLTPV